jgi:hypothetical protein
MAAAFYFMPAKVSGRFDDAGGWIGYSGAWTHTLFRPAAESTVSFSNSRGSRARLAFRGGEITWIYTKAWNRGAGTVFIDGVSRGDFDLYSPDIQAQSRSVFKVSQPGEHVFELQVAGRKSQAATDDYVDIDELIVR